MTKPATTIDYTDTDEYAAAERAMATSTGRRRVAGAVADLDASTKLTEAAEMLAARYPGGELCEHIGRMLNEASELRDNAYETMTPFELELWLDR